MAIPVDEQERILQKATALLLWAHAQRWTADRSTRLAFKLLARMTEDYPASAEMLGQELAFLIAEDELFDG